MIKLSFKEKIKKLYYKIDGKNFINVVMLCEGGSIKHFVAPIKDKNGGGRYFEYQDGFYFVVEESILTGLKRRPFVFYRKNESRPIPPAILYSEQPDIDGLKKQVYATSKVVKGSIEDNKLMKLFNQNTVGNDNKTSLLISIGSIVAVAIVYFLLSQDISAILELLESTNNGGIN